MSNSEIESMLKLVRTVQPSDFEMMQRLRAALPTDSETMRQLLNPESGAIYSREGKLVEIFSPETRFVDKWQRLGPSAPIPESQVRYWSQAIYRRFAFYARWFPHLGNGVTGDYMLCWSRSHQHFCEGLTAAANLFSHETYNSIQFRPAEEFPQFDGALKDFFKPGEWACSYQDWKQGFTLALLRFGAVTKEDRTVQETVRGYPSDIDFLKRLTEEVDRGPRSTLLRLCKFAVDWDVFLIPLRFFVQTAALNFVADQYHHTEDPSRFSKVFYKGGNAKDCAGLRLKPARPPIVRAWGKRVIKLNAIAAITHGYNAALLAQALRERYERAVSV